MYYLKIYTKSYLIINNISCTFSFNFSVTFIDEILDQINSNLFRKFIGRCYFHGIRKCGISSPFMKQFDREFCSLVELFTSLQNKSWKNFNHETQSESLQMKNFITQPPTLNFRQKLLWGDTQKRCLSLYFFTLIGKSMEVKALESLVHNEGNLLLIWNMDASVKKTPSHHLDKPRVLFPSTLILPTIAGLIWTIWPWYSGFIGSRSLSTSILFPPQPTLIACEIEAKYLHSLTRFVNELLMTLTFDATYYYLV